LQHFRERPPMPQVASAAATRICRRPGATLRDRHDVVEPSVVPRSARDLLAEELRDAEGLGEFEDSATAGRRHGT
ncbi:hypothetical protein ONA91_41465, partial [Micromonospora sp. DR5-3]|uniref:hypothetical protein n=1 Tax=unclassified Micromonospora TaxID=2617518 RepID=UPI001CA335AB